MARTETMTTTRAQRSIGGVLHQVLAEKKTFLLTSHGRPQAVIMSLEEYEALCRAEAELRLLRATERIGVGDE